MARDFVPAPTDILCERCGYLLNGLPEDGVCPECGLPVAESTTQSSRRPPPWEAGQDRPIARFQFTALSVLRSPKRFFRGMTAHGDVNRSLRFGRLAILPGLLFETKTIIMHFAVLALVAGGPQFRQTLLAIAIAAPLLVTLSWLGLYALVVRLTTIESRYWGMRLPPDVVRRALHYDAPHVSLASLLPSGVSLAYLCVVIADGDVSGRYLTAYLYSLCAAVVIAAVYLFMVYAASMRALMNANR